MLRCQREIEVRFRSDRAIAVIPNVVNAAIDEFLQPLPREKLVDVRLANARGHTGQKPGPQTMFQPAHRFVEHVLFSTALITDNFTTFDANERGGISQPAEFRGDFFRDELAIGENLKVAVGMRREQLEQLGMHERLAAQNAKESVPVLLRIGDRAV